MTNQQIILSNAIELMKSGIIAGTGRTFEYEVQTSDGQTEKRTIEEPEAIHTFATWKELGFVVNKGEHAIAAFPVWKYTEHIGEDEATHGKMYLRKAFFFKASQVSPATK